MVISFLQLGQGPFRPANCSLTWNFFRQLGQVTRIGIDDFRSWIFLAMEEDFPDPVSHTAGFRQEYRTFDSQRREIQYRPAIL